jgi:lipopolysaccharide transport system ATP-binding protein
MGSPMSFESMTECTAAPAEVVIEARALGKCYQLYDKPVHRMLQSLVGRRHVFYREFWALRGVGFELRRGETLGIVGRNGAGKSTLLQLLAGTLKASEGQVATHGRVAALLELGSGFNPEFTGRQNVYLNASILGLSRKEVEARIDSILAYADIGEFVDQPVRNYSTGMVMRLAFAVVVHVDADVLIIDEALVVGDAFFMQKCMRYLREFRKRGSMLFVSHDSSAVASLCDRALWLEHGGVRQLGEAREVMEEYMQASLSEACGMTGAGPAGAARRPAAGPRRQVDVRQALLDRTTLRNDFHVLPFQPDAKAFGQCRVRIDHAELRDEQGQAVSLVLAGESVELVVELQADATVGNVITGFYVKDRLGQLLFGDNTALTQSASFALATGERARASFRFVMPRLLPGEYFVAIGVSEGTQEQHVVQHWMHEGLRFRAEGGSMVAGLLGLPMLDIRQERLRDEH